MRRFQRCLVLIAIACTTTITGWGGDGGDPQYPVKEIPAALLKDANAIIRNYERRIEIVSINKVIYHETIAVTILNKKADFFAYVYEMYDKSSKVTAIDARVFDERGEEINKLRKADLVDESFISGFSLYEDNRVKYADMTEQKYPYTVVSVVELTMDHLYDLADFHAMQYENVSVQKSTLTVIAPEELVPRYKVFNFQGSPDISSEAGKKQLTWQFKNLEAMEKEPFGRDVSEKAPVIMLAPGAFSYEGYDGDMSSWKELGKWIQTLNDNRNTLPESTVKKLQEMTRGMTDREKARAIYTYMQNRTRYVSIQLGIGGLQPFESGVVDEVGYGDCKALSFYTKSLLEAVDVPAVYTLVSAGRSHTKLHDDFPSDIFNHVILAVPMETDTVWLECTSQTQPFNFLGSFTDNRKVLMITPEGGAVVNTPVYDENLNRQERVAKIDISAEGQASARINTRYTGLQTEYGGLETVLTLGAKDQKEWVFNVTRIPHYELEKYDFRGGEEGELPYVDVDMALSLPKFTSQSGARMFFQPNLMNQANNPLPQIEKREDPIEFRYGYFDSDSIIYSMPSSLRPEFIPDPVRIESEFGVYETHFEFIQGQLIYVRKLRIHGQKIPPEKYNDIRDFYGRISREDKRKVVLLKGT